jgi:hypothetical protein
MPLRRHETSTFLRFLDSVVPEQSQRLRDLAGKPGLTFLLDDEAEEILFQAHSHRRKIIVGRKCLWRLRAHAYVYVFCWSAIGNQTEQHRKMMQSVEARNQFFEPANRMLIWAMGRDLQIALARQGYPMKLEQEMRTHPPGYDPLFQTLRQFVDSDDKEEWQAVSSFVDLSLFLHVHNRGLDYDPERLNGPFDETADYLIDLVSHV